MAIVDTKKDLKLGQSVAEAVQNADDNFTTLFDNQDDLQTQINGKEAKFDKNTAFNKNFATDKPVMDGTTASAGSANTVARGDHKHPTDTSRLAVNPDGTNNLIVDGKINTKYIPDSVLGQLEYKGTWDASAGTSGLTVEKGHYYICSKAGSKYPNASASSVSFAVGDWVVYNGTSWDKVDNTDAVTMVNGQIGNVQTYKGTYSGSTTYHPGDIVTGTDGCLYLFINSMAANGKLLTDKAAWKIFGKTYDNATTSAAGLMSATDKTNLDKNTSARHTHGDLALLESYDQTNANIKDAVAKRHKHENWMTLDNITAAYTTEEKQKLSEIDDSLLGKTFDEFGKVVDVKLNGETVLDSNGVAVLNIGYHVELTQNSDGTIPGVTEEQLIMLSDDPTSYIVLSTKVPVEHRIYKKFNTNGDPEFTYVSKDGKISVLTVSTTGGNLTEVSAELTKNKSTSLSASSTDTQYPSAKAVVSYVGGQIKITDIKKPGENGTSIVNSTTKIATLPNINLGNGSASYAANSSSWVTKTINSKTYYGVVVPAGFKAMLNANGEQLLCQLIYDSSTKKFTACIAEKQAVTIISEAPAYA